MVGNNKNKTISNENNPKRDVDQPMVYQIRIKGHLVQQWTDWFEGLTITLEEDGNSLLTGQVIDQPALHGLLKKVRDLGLPLLSVNLIGASPQDTSDAGQPNETQPASPKKGKSTMDIQRIAAFSYNNTGGNPAGVVICDEMPTDEKMLEMAKQIGYSETAFLKQTNDGWRVRYFAPEMEVPFCGHATIASGAVLGERFPGTARQGRCGERIYKLFINQGEISVSISKSSADASITTLQSPETWSETAPQEYIEEILSEFNWTMADLDTKYPVRFAFAGAKHLIIVLKERKKLAEMSYHFDQVKTLMQKEGLVTINLLWVESNGLFHSRNPFPTGGVYEDPATGAAAAALAGYLRDIEWQGGNSFDILQGEDMGSPSRLSVQFTMNKGESIKVSGETRHIT